MSFHILETEESYLFVYGIVDGGTIWYGFTSFSINNIVPLILWILLLFSGISGIVGVSYKENPKKIKKLLLIAGLTVLIEGIYFTAIYFLNYGLYTIGLGYYCILVIIFLYFLSAGLITNYQKI